MAQTVEPDKWYLVVECQNPDCQRGIAFQEAPPPPQPVDLPTTIELTCPHCGHSAAFDPASVRRSQGQYKH